MEWSVTGTGLTCTYIYIYIYMMGYIQVVGDAVRGALAGPGYIDAHWGVPGSRLGGAGASVSAPVGGVFAR